MDSLIPINSLSDVKENSSVSYEKRKKILIAISTLMAVGFILSAFLNAHWFIPLIFFTLALVHLFPLGRAIDHERQRCLGKNLLKVF